MGTLGGRMDHSSSPGLASQLGDEGVVGPTNYFQGPFKTVHLANTALGILSGSIPKPNRARREPWEDTRRCSAQLSNGNSLDPLARKGKTGEEGKKGQVLKRQ